MATTWFKTYNCMTRQGTITTQLLWRNDDGGNVMTICACTFLMITSWSDRAVDDRKEDQC
jgi:hypothetical protein